MKKKDLIKLIEPFHDEMDVVLYDTFGAKDIAFAVPANSTECGDVFDPQASSVNEELQPVIMLVGYGDFVETGKALEWDDLC